MTKYYNNKPNPYADIPISIAASDDEDEEIICPSCHCNTVIRRESDDYCTRCNHTFNVKREVETADILESESMDSHNETLVSELPDALDAYYRKSKPEYQGAFRALQDRGIRITSYTERSGNGRVTNSWNEGSGSSSSDRRVSAPKPGRFTEDRNSEDSDSE